MSLQAQAQPAEEDFSAAFEQFSKDEKPAATEGGNDAGADPGPTGVDSNDAGGVSPDPAPPADGGEGAVQPAADATPSGEAPAAAEPGAEPAAEAAAQPAAQEPAAEAAAGPSTDDILNRLADIVREKPAAEQPAAEQPANEELPPIFTKDEEEFLTGFEKDWGDVHKAQQLYSRQFGRDLVQYVFQQIGPQIQELNRLTDALANRAHFADLEQKVGPIDDTLSTQIDAWVGKQQGYLQNAYKQVLTNGTADEVADLVERFKKETGVAAKPTAAPSKGGSELSEPAKQAAESLAPVSTKRTVIEAQEDPNDFGAAFAKFTDMFKD